MVRALLAFALVARVEAEVPTCQQADETTLLQGYVMHRNAQSLRPARMSPAEVVEWAAANPADAEAWVANDPAGAAAWVAANPDEADTIFDNNPDLEALLPSEEEGAMELKKLDTTKCLDGTPAGYYSDIKGDSDVWVIYIKGGGACHDSDECEDRSKNQKTLGSSGKWPSHLDGTSVISANCKGNPHFCEANHVYIPYCSGDTHQGQRADKHEGFYMSGHLNFKAIIDDLLATTSLGSASRVLLTGNSAGGVGTISNADTLTSKLKTENPDVIVKASPTAAWFTPDETDDGALIVSYYEDFSAGRATDPDLVLATWRSNAAWSDPYPSKCPPSEGEKCANVPTRAAYVETPMFIFENMWDTYHLTNLYQISTKPTDWSDSEKEWVFYYAKAMQASTAKIGTKDGNGLFLPATLGHGPSSGRVVDGHDYFDVLADWFYDENELPHVLTDACDSEQECLGKLGL